MSSLGAVFSTHLPFPACWHLSFLPCIGFDEFPIFKVQVWVRLHCWWLLPPASPFLPVPLFVLMTELVP